MTTIYPNQTRTMPQTETMPEQQTPDPDRVLAGQNVMEELSRHIYLTCLTIGWPKLSYKIGKAIVEVTKTGDDGEVKKIQVDEEFRNDPAWKLMPDEWKNIFTRIEGRGRKALSSASASYATKGMSLLPISRAEGVFQVLADLRGEWEMQRDLFVSAYAEILRDIEQKLRAKDVALWNKVKDRLPSVEEVRGKFSFRWSIIPLGGGGQVGLQVTREDLEKVKAALDRAQIEHPDIDDATDIVNGLIDQTHQIVQHLDDDTASALVREAKDQILDLGQQLVANICKEPREQIASAVENMLQSIRDRRRIQNGTINQIKEAFELMRGFDFVCDRTLLNRMREAERALDNVTVQELNASEETGRGIARYLEDVLTQATSEDAIEEVQEQFRGIRGALDFSDDQLGV